MSFTRITKPILPTPISRVFVEETKKETNEVKVKGKMSHKVQALQGPETFVLTTNGKMNHKVQALQGPETFLLTTSLRPQTVENPLGLTPFLPTMDISQIATTTKGKSIGQETVSYFFPYLRTYLLTLVLPHF